MASGCRSQPPASLPRRHFMRITAAGAARLSSIVIAGSLLTGKSADALGILPPGDPNRGGDDHGGRPNCFGRGTLILTANGEVPVEELAVGELAITTRGASRIKWVGRTTLRRNVSGSWHPSVLPIRVARFALDDQTPRRDLNLSGEHCLFIDGVLIPVKHLVNECSIAVDRNANTSEVIEYFCIELDSHQVIFAEGAAAETFQYCGGQIAWDNLRDYQDLYGCEHAVMPAFAPHCRYEGGRAETRALLRLAASRFVELRDPLQLAYARIASRAMSMAA